MLDDIDGGIAWGVDRTRKVIGLLVTLWWYAKRRTGGQREYKEEKENIDAVQFYCRLPIRFSALIYSDDKLR